MASAGEEPLGSMGTDTPLAVLSERPRLLYDYFKQLFAQVTNPPLDAIREELVTSMASTIGPERNLLEPEPESCRQITIKYPILDNHELAKLRHVDAPGFRSVTLPMLLPAPRKAAPASSARWTSSESARQRGGRRAAHTILILSDRGVNEDLAPIPEPAGDGRRAPSPGARRRAHQMRPRRRIRRRARSASHGAAHRLRRRRGRTRIWRSRRSTT